MSEDSNDQSSFSTRSRGESDSHVSEMSEMTSRMSKQTHVQYLINHVCDLFISCIFICQVPGPGPAFNVHQTKDGYAVLSSLITVLNRWLAHFVDTCMFMPRTSWTKDSLFFGSCMCIITGNKFEHLHMYVVN